MSEDKRSLRLGFIGLGIMGGTITNMLLEKGYNISGYNRTRSKAEALIEKGMPFVDSPAAMVEKCDIIMVMVTDARASQSIYHDPVTGILKGLSNKTAGERQTLIVDLSTIPPHESCKLATEVRALGADMCDCPVSGSHISLLQGKASFMVGGTATACESVRPILLDVGCKVTHVGTNGQALSMKIAVNLNLAVQMLAVSESILLAEKAGIARKTAIEVLQHSAIASPMINYRTPLITEDTDRLPTEAWFNMKMMQKDIHFAMRLGDEYKVPLPTTSTVNEYLTMARAMGYENEDFAALYHVLGELSGRDKPMLHSHSSDSTPSEK
jgi:3-hydroxyisobutyrate dehydrogenase-like beta-hydroxyacid dehydrogenase